MMTIACGPTSCAPCSLRDRIADTVKFDASLVEATLLAQAAAEDAEKGRRLEAGEGERAEWARVEEEEEEEESRLAEQHRRAEEARRLEEAQQVEQQRLEEEARSAAQVAEEARQRVETARRLQEKGVVAEAKVQAETEEAQRIVEEFLLATGFKSLSTPRKKCCSTSYALHKAVEDNEAEVVKAMLRCGAELGQKSSSGKTPYEVAERLHSRKGLHGPIIELLAPGRV